ncbi:MAG: hypothetical protein D6739_12680 [Nitrospirae bacterium]|nr:MAG: hypothetical protein D6739_12680 [Nitrospirota bacterium]
MCARSEGFLHLPASDQWIGEEDAARKLAGLKPYEHRITIPTRVPKVVAFCHRPPYCYTMMTKREYDGQSWLPGVP